MSTLKENIKQAFNELFANITWNIDDIRLFDNPLWYPIYPPRFKFEAKQKTGYKNERKCFEILRKHVQSQNKEDVLLVFDLDDLMCNLINVNKLLKKCVEDIKKELTINSGLTSDFILIDKNYGIFLIDSKGSESVKNKEKATKQGKVFQSIMMNYIDGLDESYFQVLVYFTTEKQDGQTDKQDEDFIQTFILKNEINKREKPMSDEIFDECVKFLLRLKYNKDSKFIKSNDCPTGDRIIKEENRNHGTALENYVSCYAEIKTIAGTDSKKRIIAGPAGCGKTQVLKQKVENLIKSKQEKLTLIVVSSQTEKMYSYIQDIKDPKDKNKSIKSLLFKGNQYFYFYFDEMKKFNTRNIKCTLKRLDFSTIISLEIFISSKDKLNCFFKISTLNGKIIRNYLSDYAIRSEYEVSSDDDISEFITAYFGKDGEFCFRNVTIYYDYDYKTNVALSKFLDLFEKVSSHWETSKIQKIEMTEANLDEKLLELFKYSVILVEPDSVNLLGNFSNDSLFSILKKFTMYSNNKVDVLIDDFQAYGLMENNGFKEIDKEKMEKIDHLWITLDLYQFMKRKNSPLNRKTMFDFSNEEFSFHFMNKVLRCSKKIFDMIDPIYRYMKMNVKQEYDYEAVLLQESSYKNWFNCYECLGDYIKAQQKPRRNIRNLSQELNRAKKKVDSNTSYYEFIKYYIDVESDIKCGYDYEADGEVRILPIEYSESESEVIDKLVKTVRDTIEMLLELFNSESIAVYIDSYYSISENQNFDHITKALNRVSENEFKSENIAVYKTINRENKIIESLKILKQQEKYRDIYIIDDLLKDSEFSAEFDAVIYVAPGILNDNDINDVSLNRIYCRKSNPYLLISRAIHDLTIIYVRCDEHKSIGSKDQEAAIANCSTNTYKDQPFFL